MLTMFNLFVCIVCINMYKYITDMTMIYNMNDEWHNTSQIK